MPAKLRAIDKGTLYDVPGKLRRFVRKIEQGQIDPRDVVVITRESVGPNRSCKVGMYHFGSASTESVHWMIATALGRIEPQ